MYRLLRPLLFLALLLPLAGCHDDEDRPGPDFVTRLSLETPAGDTRERFTRGEDVVVVLEVRNRSRESRTLSFPDARVSDFVALDENGRERRLWSHDKFFSQVITEEVFEAGSRRRFEMSWPGLDGNDGQPLAAGEYEIQGWLPVEGEDGTDDLSPGPYRSALETFVIED